MCFTPPAKACIPGSWFSKAAGRLSLEDSVRYSVRTYTSTHTQAHTQQAHKHIVDSEWFEHSHDKPDRHHGAWPNCRPEGGPGQQTGEGLIFVPTTLFPSPREIREITLLMTGMPLNPTGRWSGLRYHNSSKRLQVGAASDSTTYVNHVYLPRRSCIYQYISVLLVRAPALGGKCHCLDKHTPFAHH